MDQKLLNTAIQDLRKRKHQIGQVILMLKTLGTDKPRRGRPPKLLAETLAAIGEADSPKRAVKKRKNARKKPAS